MKKEEKMRRNDITITVHNNVINVSSQGSRRDGPLCITSNRIICLLLTNDNIEEAHLLCRFSSNGIFSSVEISRLLGNPLALVRYHEYEENSKMHVCTISREPLSRDIKK